MESNLRVTFNDLEISPGKRVRYSENKTVKRSKLTERNIQETNFVKASIKVSQSAQLDTLKRLKLLNFPRCSICMNTSTKVSNISLLFAILNFGIYLKIYKPKDQSYILVSKM